MSTPAVPAPEGRARSQLHRAQCRCEARPAIRPAIPRRPSTLRCPAGSTDRGAAATTAGTLHAAGPAWRTYRNSRRSSNVLLDMLAHVVQQTDHVMIIERVVGQPAGSAHAHQARG